MQGYRIDSAWDKSTNKLPEEHILLLDAEILEYPCCEDVSEIRMKAK